MLVEETSTFYLPTSGREEITLYCPGKRSVWSGDNQPPFALFSVLHMPRQPTQFLGKLGILASSFALSIPTPSFVLDSGITIQAVAKPIILECGRSADL